MKSNNAGKRERAPSTRSGKTTAGPKRRKRPQNITVTVVGAATLKNVQKAIESALKRLKTDLYADVVDDTLTLILQHQVGPAPPRPEQPPPPPPPHRPPRR
jgi:hypothetical protein